MMAMGPIAWQQLRECYIFVASRDCPTPRSELTAQDVAERSIDWRYYLYIDNLSAGKALVKETK
jgi:hypothetical protein